MAQNVGECRLSVRSMPPCDGEALFAGVACDAVAREALDELGHPVDSLEDFVKELNEPWCFCFRIEVEVDLLRDLQAWVMWLQLTRAKVDDAVANCEQIGMSVEGVRVNTNHWCEFFENAVDDAGALCPLPCFHL